MVKSYEELVGALGREQQFRRRRYEAEDFFAGSPPALFFNDMPFVLENLSGSGTGASQSLSLSAGAMGEVNQHGVLRLVQHGEELLRVSARCARTSQLSGRVFAGFELDNDQLDLADLRRRNALAIAKFGLRQPTRDGVTPEYKAFCSDVAAFVGGQISQIDRHLTPIESGLISSERKIIFEELMAAAEPEWRAILCEGNEFALAVHSDQLRLAAMKKYTEATVTPVLTGGEVWNRCYYKPMGYPGDYKIMNYMYDRSPMGSGIRENFLHGLGLIAGYPIFTRMLKLSELIVSHFANCPTADPRLIASVGCGPAREMEHIVAGMSGRSNLIATLIDQEAEALEFATEYSRARFDKRRLTLKAYNASFKSMFNPAGIAELVDQDVIYSLGLVDYFSPLLARRFVSRAYDLVRPGGMVIIGNASNSPKGTLWTMEHVLDWSLYFRDRDEMAALAGDIKGASIAVEADPLDSIYFLIVKKPH